MSSSVSQCLQKNGSSKTKQNHTSDKFSSIKVAPGIRYVCVCVDRVLMWFKIKIIRICTEEEVQWSSVQNHQRNEWFWLQRCQRFSIHKHQRHFRTLTHLIPPSWISYSVFAFHLQIIHALNISAESNLTLRLSVHVLRTVCPYVVQVMHKNFHANVVKCNDPTPSIEI